MVTLAGWVARVGQVRAEGRFFRDEANPVEERSPISTSLVGMAERSFWYEVCMATRPHTTYQARESRASGENI
jgi:hypothetical protein